MFCVALSSKQNTFRLLLVPILDIFGARCLISVVLLKMLHPLDALFFNNRKRDKPVYPIFF